MSKNQRIYLSSPHMSDEGYEKAFVKEAFDTNWVAPLGTNVNEFEKEMQQKIKAGAAAALISGTAAIHLALKCIGVGKGDIVFCPTLTFAATANPIIYQRAIPVFVDSDYDTWNMSPAALRKAVEKYKAMQIHPKALIVVHLYGMSAKLDEITSICEENDIVLIEDAAESLGTKYKGKCTGTIGKYGILSFNGNKIITSSGGGMLLVNGNDAEDKADKARFWATQSREKTRHYEHTEIGYNYRMSNVVAGIGRGQLKILDLRVEKKRYIYNYYLKRLSGIEDISMMPQHDWEYSNCWLSCIQIKNTCEIKPIDIMLALEKDNIECRPIWKPMHMQPVFAACDYVDNGGVARSLFENGLCLPSDTKMTDDDLERICNIIIGLWS